MADCYIAFKPPTIYLRVRGSHSSLGNAMSNTYEVLFDSTSVTFNIPNGIDITEAYCYHTCSTSTSSSSNVASISSTSAWTDFKDSNNNKTRLYNSGNSSVMTNIPDPNTTFTIECAGQVGVYWNDASAPNTQCSLTQTFTFNPYLRLKVTIPTIETVITAEKLNAFAAILNTSTVTIGDTIVRAPWQAIGTAIGTMKTAIDGNSNASAVTFDSTKPLSSNLQSVITNMTDKYLILSS